jgi:2-keto-3-deoxy-L-rhamnonate aldolase RhmA
MLKRALDAGAQGIVTPMCHSEVRALWIRKDCEKRLSSPADL